MCSTRITQPPALVSLTVELSLAPQLDEVLKNVTFLLFNI